jgi:mannose-6-phosphate isomerase-like protein (cupin superfamily)
MNRRPEKSFMPYHFIPMKKSVCFDAGPTVAAVVAHYRARLAAGPRDAIADELARVLELLPEVKCIETDNLCGDPSHPVGGFVEDALASKPGAVEDVLATLRPLAHLLPWRYNYEPRKDRPGLENCMAWAEFIGPEAPVRSEKVCFGVTLIGLHTFYPAHHHPATESYFVLSGTATWTRAGIAQILPPGSFILHPSNIVHSMEAASEPLLAAYTWTGDLNTLSIYEEGASKQA